jgi:hypothetical protein
MTFPQVIREPSEGTYQRWEQEGVDQIYDIELGVSRKGIFKAHILNPP